MWARCPKVPRENPSGLGGEGRDRPEAACPPGSRAADGEAGGFNAVQKVLTTGLDESAHRTSRRSSRMAVRSGMGGAVESRHAKPLTELHDRVTVLVRVPVRVQV